MRAPSARRPLGLRIGVTPGVSSGVWVSAREEGVSREGPLRQISRGGLAQVLLLYWKSSMMTSERVIFPPFTNKPA